MKQAMLCARCTTKCTWPDDFPNTTYAICRPCTNIEQDEIEARADWFFIILGGAFVLAALVVAAVVFFL